MCQLEMTTYYHHHPRPVQGGRVLSCWGVPHIANLGVFNQETDQLTIPGVVRRRMLHLGLFSAVAPINHGPFAWKCPKAETSRVQTAWTGGSVLKNILVIITHNWGSTSTTICPQCSVSYSTGDICCCGNTFFWYLGPAAVFPGYDMRPNYSRHTSHKCSSAKCGKVKIFV